MSQNGIGEWNVPDFSSLKLIARGIQEMFRTAAETALRLKETLRPIAEAAEQYKEKLTIISATVFRAALVINAIKKLGEAQFVYWEVMDRAFVEMLVESKNVNKTLREFLVREKFASMYATIERTKVHPLMKKQLRLYTQAISSFENGHNDIAVNALTSVFDGILSAVSGKSTHRLPDRVKTITEKLEKQDVLENDEYAVITLGVTIERTMESFVQGVSFDQPEPKGLNRHWIAHGRSTRRKTKLDVVKMVNLIYGLLLINDLDAGVVE